VPRATQGPLGATVVRRQTHGLRNDQTLAGIPRLDLDTIVWRVTQKKHDPIWYSPQPARWSRKDQRVLYLSLEKEGARAEAHFHLSQGGSILRQNYDYVLYKISISVTNVFDLTDWTKLELLGLNRQDFGNEYWERKTEYEKCQHISELVERFGHSQERPISGILVPSARYECNNLVLFQSYNGLCQIVPTQEPE